jgi:pSer/pThr/pTyr-binding forkhead associated (FHA) protein
MFYSQGKTLSVRRVVNNSVCHPSSYVHSTNDELPSSTELPLAFLIVTEGPQWGQPFRLKKKIVRIGRALEENEIVINDKYVSICHAEISYQDNGEYLLRDLESMNSTYLNGRRITTSKISNNDTIEIGKTKMVFMVISQTLSEAAHE